MDQRLSIYTAHVEDMHARDAIILTALVEHLLGSHARNDPDLLDQFLAGRGVNKSVKLLVKTAVAPGDTSNPSWGGSLAAAVPKPQAFIAAVDRRSVLGKLQAVKVPVSNAVGAVQNLQASAYWIGESMPKPLSLLGFVAAPLSPRKVVADVAADSELIRMANVDMLRLLENSTVSAVAAAVDAALLDPLNAGVPNVKPASLTNGLTPVVAAGDFQNTIGLALAAISGGAPTKPTIVVSLQTALRLTGLRDLTDIGINVIVSAAAGPNVIAIDADGVAVMDDGGAVKIGQPDIEMSSTPAAPAVAATVMTSTWQRNQSVVRGERWTNWTKRPDACAYLVLA